MRTYIAIILVLVFATIVLCDENANIRDIKNLRLQKLDKSAVVMSLAFPNHSTVPSTSAISSANAKFPNMTSVVPYSGAIKNVNLNNKQLTLDQINLNVAPTSTPAIGSMFWNPSDQTVSIQNDANTTLDIGHENYIRVVNKTGVQINDGQVVFVHGAQGNRPKAQLAIATNYSTSRVIGVATENIPNNQEGSITTFGVVHGYDTSSFANGSSLYLSPITAGALTMTQPSTPYYSALVAIALNSTNNGSIMVSTRQPVSTDVSLLSDNSTNTTPPSQLAVRTKFNNNSTAFQSKLDSKVNSVGATSPVVSSGGTSPTISMPAATDAVNGYMTAVDHALLTADTTAVTNLGYMFGDTADPSGFVDPAGLTISYDSTARTITVTHSGHIYYQWQGVRKELGSGGTWTSSAHANTTGHSYFLYTLDGVNFTWAADTPWQFYYVQVAYVYFGASDKYALREGHGIMPWTAHQELHQTLGTYLDSTGISLTYTGTQPDVSSCIIHDEDNATTNAALTHGATAYTHLYLSGVGATSTFSTSNPQIIHLNAGTSVPQYNQNNAGTWQLTDMANNSYSSIWLVAVPAAADSTSQKYRYLWLQGQSNSSTLGGEQVTTFSGLNLGQLTSVFTEFVPVARIIINHTNGTTFTIAQTDYLTGTKIGLSQSTSNGITSLTGDGAATGPGTATLTVNSYGGGKGLAAAFTHASTATYDHINSVTPYGGHPAAGSDKQIQYSNRGTPAGATYLNYSSPYTFVRNGGKLGVSTNNPQAPIHLHLKTALGAITDPGTSLYNVSTGFAGSAQDNTFQADYIVADGTSTAGYRGAVRGVRARGSLVSPSAPLLDDQVFSALGGVYTGYLTEVWNAADIQYIVDGTIAHNTGGSSVDSPVRITFKTRPKGFTWYERLTIKSGGNVGINQTSPTSILHVTGLPSYGGASMTAANTAAKAAGHTAGAFFLYSTAGVRQPGVVW